MSKYTTFCQQKDRGGTIHITSVDADDVQQAIERGIAECWDDWGGDDGEYELSDIHCLGVAEGDVTILHWEDQCD